MRASVNVNKIALFLSIVFVLTALAYIPILTTGVVDGWGVALLMWAPGVAALLTQWLTTRSLRGLGWGWGKSRYQLVAFLLPLLICGVVYGFLWATSVVSFAPAAMVDRMAQVTGQTFPLPMALLVALLVIWPSSLLTATGEEIGWRGLLVPELAQRYRFTATSVISGLIWAVYHVPAIFFADYHSSAPVWYALVMFTLMTVGASFVYAWLRLKSGSLWTAAILHASHNFFIQIVFDTMTPPEGLAPYLTTEFGVGLVLAYAVAAFYFWRRRAEVEGMTA